MSSFEKIGWGTIPNSISDDGTDVLVFAKSRDLVPLRLMVAMQVKTGPSWFRSPKREGGRVVGWWFSESAEDHFDAWLNFPLPHLVVLHDLDAAASYWAHVTPGAVHASGAGRKILVPSDQLVDDAGRDALEAVALTGRRVISWEGTIWEKPTIADTRQLLRYALMTPRLVSPHPNAGPVSDVSAYQAIAMLCEARLQELESLGLMKSLGQLPSSWPWRLFAALRSYLMDCRIDSLLQLPATAGRGISASAAVAVAAAALVTEGRADDAVPVLEAQLAKASVTHVDRAWLQLQLARALNEIGETGRARNLAERVVRVRDRQPSDATAPALASAAAILLFNTASPREHDFPQLMAAVDIAPMWWLTQLEFSGLVAGAGKAFERRCRNEPIAFGGDDPEVNKVIASATISSWTGDQSSWTQITTLAGKALLCRTTAGSSDNEIRGALRSLVSAGDEKAIKMAVTALIDEGFANVVRSEATAGHLTNLGRTSAPAVMTFLQSASDVLDERVANQALDWCLEVVRAPAAFIARTTPTYLVAHRFLEMVEALLPQASISRRRAVAKLLAATDPLALGPLEQAAWSRICAELRPGDWTAQTRRAVLASFTDQPEPLSSVVATSALPPDEARSRLRTRVIEGSIGSLAGLGDVRLLDEQVAAAAIAGLSDSLRDQTAKAAEGSVMFGGLDVASDLALFNVWHPDQARWQALLSFLSEEAVPPGLKQRPLARLAEFFRQLPDPTSRELVQIAARLSVAIESSLYTPFERQREAWGASTMVLAAARQESAIVDSRFVELLGMSEQHRIWACRIAGASDRDDYTGALVGLAGDTNPHIRAVAAGELARQIADGRGDALARATLTHRANDPSVLDE